MSERESEIVVVQGGIDLSPPARAAIQQTTGGELPHPLTHARFPLLLFFFFVVFVFFSLARLEKEENRFVFCARSYHSPPPLASTALLLLRFIVTVQVPIRNHAVFSCNFYSSGSYDFVRV